jgi:hypothetical protein
LKTEKAGVAQRADWPSSPFRSERMCAVFDHRQAMTPRDANDALDVARKAVQVSRYDGAGAGCDRAFEGARIEREQSGVDVSEDRLQTSDSRQFRDDPEGQRRQDDLGSFRQLQRLKQVVERHPAV